MACTIASLVPGCLLCHRGSSIGKVVGASETALHLDTDDHGLQQGDIIEVLTGMEAPVLALRLFLPELARQEAVVSMRLGTTKATNALLERKGARVALMVSSGFEDLLVIKDQKRPDLFARSIQRSPPLYHRVYGIGGTISASGEEVLSLDESALLSCARDALASGCEAVALCLKNSCHNPLHEVRALALLSEMGFKSLHASVSLTSRMHYQKRAETVLVNAMLDPLLGSYLDAVEAALDGTALKVMTSSGGLVDRCRFNAIDSLVSGPAGGVAGAVALARQTGATKILSLDMGGTSADVCRWNGETILRPSVTVGSATVFSPALHIETVAAGGGSICCYADGALKVGPDSAGAYPGPASYGGGGPLTLTDVHWLMGRIDEARFGVPLDIRAAESALSRVVTASGMQDWKQVCLGMIQIATERMAQAIREVSAREGEDPSHYTLVVFGGAGGLHACGIAEELGIHDILFARDAGLVKCARDFGQRG
ncbi:MAG: hydantoinase/oxoprolinase family protein [Verrucomicrobia bacterium]|nr:hydantoinase/oxoprolinase family protein [Verrucomicrobiota bacterium]